MKIHSRLLAALLVAVGIPGIPARAAEINGTVHLIALTGEDIIRLSSHHSGVLKAKDGKGSVDLRLDYRKRKLAPSVPPNFRSDGNQLPLRLRTWLAIDSPKRVHVPSVPASSGTRIAE